MAYAQKLIFQGGVEAFQPLKAPGECPDVVSCYINSFNVYLPLWSENTAQLQQCVCLNCRSRMNA